MTENKNNPTIEKIVSKIDKGFNKVDKGLSKVRLNIRAAELAATKVMKATLEGTARGVAKKSIGESIKGALESTFGDTTMGQQEKRNKAQAEYQRKYGKNNNGHSR
jgi:hypothetical protein